MKSLRNLPFGAQTGTDPALSSLLERLAVLEAANYRLRNSLSERNFNVEVENAALSEKLARANEEVLHHQKMLENLCSEILAAQKARDRAETAAGESLQILSERDSLRLALADAEARAEETRRTLEVDIRAAHAAVDESLKVRAEAVSRYESLRRELDDVLKASADTETRGAQARRALDDALKASADAEAQGAEARRALENELRAARAAANESLQARSEAMLQCERLRLELDGALKASALAAQAAADESLKARSEAASRYESLRRELDGVLKAGAAAVQAAADESLRARSDASSQYESLRREFDDVLKAGAATAEENLKARSEAVSRYESLREEFDGVLKASAAIEARAAQSRHTLEEMLRVAQATAEESLRVRAEMAAECETLRRALEARGGVPSAAEPTAAPAVPESGIEYPAMEYALEPGWAKLLHLLKPPLQAAYGHLRRLSAQPMSAGQRAILRLTGVSLSSASDALATIELALAEVPATTETTPILPVLESALAAWDAVFRRRGITLTRDLSRSLSDSPHDPEQLRLALHHVMRNAMEALPRGAVVQVHLRKSAAGVAELEFRDDGPGYPAAWLERRFEPFASPRPGHAGLGLAAVRRALRRWGGDAVASNVAKGRGACLILTFAAAPARPVIKA